MKDYKGIENIIEETEKNKCTANLYVLNEYTSYFLSYSYHVLKQIKVHYLIIKNKKWVVFYL